MWTHSARDADGTGSRKAGPADVYRLTPDMSGPGSLAGLLPMNSVMSVHRLDRSRKQSMLTGCRQVAPLVRHIAALVGRPLPSALRFDTDPVVDRAADPLFATKVALRSLNRNVAEEELNLFQFSARCVT